MKARLLLASLMVAVGFSMSGTALAAIPTFSLTSAGGDSVQLTINGDANANATLFYNVGAPAGFKTYVLGVTNGSGGLTSTVSAGTLGLNTANSAYVVVNGQQSAMQPWLASASSQGTPSLSQSSLNLTVNQMATVTLQAALNTVFILSNSNPSVASLSINGGSINVTGNQAGTAIVSLCYLGTTTNCAPLTITVQAGASGSTGGSVSFDQPNANVAVGTTFTVTILGGGTAFYVGSNSNPSIMTYVLNNNAMMITGKEAGSAIVKICSIVGSNNCGDLTVTVGGSSASSSSNNSTNTTTGQGVFFSNASPSVPVGQALSVTLSGATTYFVSVNTNPVIAQTSVGGNILTITGVVAGTTSLTVCAAGGASCGTLPVTVTATAVATPSPAPTPTPVTPTTPVIPVVTTTGNSAALLPTIQLMQAQLSQMVLAIQAMQTQLKQLLATIPASSATTLGGGSTVSSAPFSGKFTSFLSLNSTGAEVTALQKKLLADGFYSGPITGTFGPLTASAVKKFQEANGLDPAGYVGPGTRAVLNQ